jgi:FecR protein
LSSPDGGRRTVVESGVRVRQGDRIELAGDSRASIVLADGIAVRFDRETAVVVEAADRLGLERGAVYVDTAGAASPLRIETPLGAVRHLGTRFEVRVVQRSLRVRVREGSIALDRRGTSVTARAGEALFAIDSQPATRTRIATSGPEWKWVGELADPFQLEGATLPSFLDWAAREEGWEWQVAGSALRARTDRIVLHGSIDGLTPAEALAAVLPASGLTFRLEGNRVLVSAASPPSSERRAREDD